MTRTPPNPPRVDVFNPRRLSDQQIAVLATGRDAIMDGLAETIRRNATGGSVQHEAFIAPRGYGKSFLLRQLRVIVEDLARTGTPVAYAHLPEELPNVTSVAALVWEIRRLMAGELSGGIGYFRNDAADDLDRAVKALDAELDARFGPGKGMVAAAVENFDELLDLLVRKAQRAVNRRRNRNEGRRKAPAEARAGDLAVELELRGLIERRSNRLMLVITATRNIRNSDPGHPLFQWIKETSLESWTESEVLDYALRRRRLSRGPTALLSANEQIQVAALAEYTSGAPRLIAVLLDHLLEQNVEQVALNLAALVDELTPYYQDRLRVLGDEARQVFDALLRGGEPASQTEIAKRFAERNLTQNEVGEAFRKLQTERLVVGQRELGGSRKATLYRASDRIMAYWYKQRQVIHHDPAANGISHFEEAVELLVQWFSRDDLAGEAERFARVGRREEAALLGYLSRHGLALQDGALRSVTAPRRHLAFRFRIRLDLMARLQDATLREKADRMIVLMGGGEVKALEAEEARVAEYVPEGRWRAFLLCVLATAYMLRNSARDDDRSKAVLDHAKSCVEGDQDFLTVVQEIAAMMDWYVDGNRQKCLDVLGARSDVLAASAAPEVQLLAANGRAFTEYYRGHYEAGLVQARRAGKLAQVLFLPVWECRALEMASYNLKQLGRLEEAVEDARRAALLAGEAGDQGSEASSRCLLGNLLFMLGRHDQALAEAELGYPMAVAVEDHSEAANISLLQAQCLNASERAVEAVAAARQAWDSAVTACDSKKKRNAKEAEFAGLTLLRRHLEALEIAEWLLESAEHGGDAERRASAQFLLGSALDYLARRDDAVVALRRCLELDPPADLRQSALALLGYCLGQLNRPEEAVPILAQAAGLGATDSEVSERFTDLHNLLIFAGRIPEDRYAAIGSTILSAFTSLAAVNAEVALDFSALALRISAALDRYDDFAAGMLLSARTEKRENRWISSLARELTRIAADRGRARAYTVCLEVLAALEPAGNEGPTARDQRAELLARLSVYLRDGGLLRDLAAFMEERLGSELRPQIAALRARAIHLESGGDPASLERVDPDLARLLQVTAQIGALPTSLPQPEDPDLAVRPCVVARAGRSSFAGLSVAAANAPLVARFRDLAPSLGIANLEAFDTDSMRAATLPFLPEAKLLLLPHHPGALAVPFVLHSHGLCLARRQNDWIYELMAERPLLDLSDTPEANAILMAYCRFFFAVIRGSLGAFKVVEGAETFSWTESAEPAVMADVGAKVQPLARIAGREGSATLTGTVLFKNALFRTSIVINASGQIELGDEELLAEDVPVRFGPAADMVAE